MTKILHEEIVFQGAQKKAREAFNEQLHKALIAKPVMAMRALLVRLLSDLWSGSMPAVLPAALAKAAAKHDEMAMWQAALQMSPEAIDKALVHLGAGDEWTAYDGPEPTPFVAAVGKAVGVEPAKVEAPPPAKPEKAKVTPKTKAAPKAKPATKAKPKAAAKKKPAAKGKKS